MKPGYKQTDVGVIPEEWEVKPFTQVTDLITCGIAATPDYVSESRGYPFLSSTNVKEGRIVWSGYKHISADLHRQLYRNNPPKKGDILYSRVGTFGEAAVVDVDFEFSVYVSLTLIKPGKPLDSFFLMQLLNSEPYKRRAKDQIYLGGGVGNLNVDVVRRYPIVVPTLSEQRAIAGALSDVDALIGALDQLIAKKRDLKQAAMQQFLTGHHRLPRFHGEWVVKRLGDVGVFSKGSGIKKDEVVADGLPCVRYGEIYTHHNDHLRAFNSFITPTTAKQSQRIEKGDLLFAGSGETSEEIGKCIAFLGDEEAYAGGDIVIFKPVDQDSKYFGYLMNHSSIASQKARLGQGDAVVHISARNLARLELHLPPLPEQTAIAEVLADMDAELAALEQRRDKTRALKQGMMQELLTGRTRLV
ncbi:MAG: restriction endonuclease subunit S [Opitutaceae bacterium]|nr:restriction endonuclease subunit S [Opitutaceae bacterium]